VCSTAACGGSSTAIVVPQGDAGESADGTSGDTGPGGSMNPTDAGDAQSAPAPEAGTDGGGGGHAVQTVFVIMMENHSASSIYAASGAPYINGTLLPMGAHATSYLTHVHPSEPNYVWLEAGDNLGITDDNDPMSNGKMTPQHLVTQLTTAGISWKAWVEAIDGNSCPLTSSAALSSGTFGAKHVPQLFFSDVTDGFSAMSATCMAHIRPFSELTTALQNGTAPRYNFIVPDLCDDMHGGQLPCLVGSVSTGDTWLSKNVPTILQSSAFQQGGLLLVVWDEGDEPLGGTASDGPLPVIAVGSMVKSNYPSPGSYTHSSTLKTIEEIFGVSLLGGAADPATSDLFDMFSAFP
jgi:hypothetical protein